MGEGQSIDGWNTQKAAMHAFEVSSSGGVYNESFRAWFWGRDLLAVVLHLIPKIQRFLPSPEV